MPHLTLNKGNSSACRDDGLMRRHEGPAALVLNGLVGGPILG